MYALPTATQPVQSMGPTARAAFAVISTMLFGTGSVYGMNRADAWRHYVQPRVAFILDTADVSLETPSRLDVRTAAEHVENIHSILNPSVADLANLFDISRQAIYKWLSGDSTPEPDKLNRITELSRIADVFRAAGISRAGSMLKMKTFSGRSLMDLLKAGENSSEHVAALISEAKAMEASYKQSGLASSKSRPTSDWQSSISIPGSSEQA